MSIPKWTDERTDILTNIVDGEDVVTQDTVVAAADELETTPRSVASKLRNLGFVVESSSVAKTPTFTDEEQNELSDFVSANPGEFTYAQVAEQVCNGKFTSKQVQGKILSMELTEAIAATPKAEAVKTYTDEEEATLLGLVRKGDFIEDIASAMGREVASIRGKVLSLSRTHEDISIPKQRNYVSKDAKDALTELGDISDLTVEEIAEKLKKTERGVKTMLTHRGLDASNYSGSKRKEKNEAKKTVA